MAYYADLTHLPKDVQEVLPLHAQIIYVDAFNAAWEDWEDIDTAMLWFDRETIACQEAWTAVKKVYRKDERTGQWRRRGYRLPQLPSEWIGARPG